MRSWLPSPSCARTRPVPSPLTNSPSIAPPSGLMVPSPSGILLNWLPTLPVPRTRMLSTLASFCPSSAHVPRPGHLTIPSFRNFGDPQPYFPHPPVNHSPPSYRHHVRLSDPPSRLSRPLDQHDLNTLIPTQYVPVIPFPFLSGSASCTNPSRTNPSHGTPSQSIQQIPSSTSQYLSTHQPTELGDLSISQQIEFDAICSDYLTMLSPTRMDSTNIGH